MIGILNYSVALHNCKSRLFFTPHINSTHEHTQNICRVKILGPLDLEM
jgi:hypothetical protein